MQTNDFVGQIEHGSRRPQAEQALTAKRATPEDPTEHWGEDARRRPAARLPARRLRCYGAGF